MFYVDLCFIQLDKILIENWDNLKYRESVSEIK
jgi:hypothetical protein